MAKAAAAKNELAVVDSFQIVSGFEGMSDEEREELMDEMGDLDENTGIQCLKIKIPAGGGKAFEVETEDPSDPDVMKEIQGVIIFTHRMNAYWPEKFGGDSAAGGSNPPECSSWDAKSGLNAVTGELRNCDGCPHNLFGADGAGKACKNMRRIYLMMNGRPDVYLLSVPPTSIRDINKQLARIMGSQRIPYTRMVMKFHLEQAVNKNGISYSKVTVEKGGMLPPETAKLAAELRQQLKESYRKVAIGGEDDVYEAQPRQDEGLMQPAQEAPAGFQDAPDGFEDVLPFN